MRASGYERETNDWYVEPEWIVEALLKKEKFEGLCWDPACGSGNILRAILKQPGSYAFGTDKFTRVSVESEEYDFSEQDFLIPNGPFHRRPVKNIISNPPYSILTEFVYQGLKVASHKVAFLARLAFLEGQSRERFFKETPLARVYVSRKRVSMPPGGTNIPAKGGTVAYAWFVWEHGHTGLPQLDWI